MARSMTGFGAGRAALDEGGLRVEIRAVNHRHVDLRVELPPSLAGLAYEAERRLRPRLTRGRFDVAVELEGLAAPAAIDPERAAAAYQELAALRDALAPGTELPIGVLAQVPEVFRATPRWSRAAALEAFDVAATMALEGLGRMREAEGRAVTADVLARLAEARALRASILAAVPELVEAHRTRLHERLRRLLAPEVPLDPGRLEVEIALLADRSDVSEELARLASHFDQLEATLASPEPVGRRLDFLLQETMREANTVGSKSASAAIAHAVVDLKTAIERMREQVQNLE